MILKLQIVCKVVNSILIWDDRYFHKAFVDYQTWVDNMSFIALLMEG